MKLCTQQLKRKKTDVATDATSNLTIQHLFPEHRRHFGHPRPTTKTEDSQKPFRVVRTALRYINMCATTGVTSQNV